MPGPRSTLHSDSSIQGMPHCLPHFRYRQVNPITMARQHLFERVLEKDLR